MTNTILMNGTLYEFNFGMGFIRDINKKVCQSVDGIKGFEDKIGATVYFTGVVNGDIECLETVLMTAANKKQDPPLTVDVLDAYIDDDATDIDKLFSDVTDFLSQANASKKILKKAQDIQSQQKTALDEKLKQELTV